MKHLLFALLLLPVASRSFAQDEPGGTMLNALVTVQISDLEARWPKVSARITKEPGMNVEYSCMTTGILVLRMQGLTVGEKSDVMAIVKRIMREAGVKGAIEFLDVHVEPGDGNRCAVPGMLPYRCG